MKTITSLIFNWKFNLSGLLKISLFLQLYLSIFLFKASAQDIVTYLGRDLSIPRSGQLTDVLDLGNGKYAIIGTDNTLDWIPLGTPRSEISFPNDKIDNDLGTGKYPFILIIDTVLHNKSIEKVFYVEKNKIENFRFIRHTGYPGVALGDLYISGDRASSTKPGYFIGKLDKNIVSGDPTTFSWIYNVGAAAMMFTHQPWDVGGDGKVVFGEGTAFSNSWAALRRLKADGTLDVVSHWRVHFKADGTEVVDSIAPTDAVNSCSSMKIDGRGCIQSMNLADYNLISSDGNGGWKKGKYPFDIFFKGDISGTWDISGQGGYTGYRKGANRTGGIGSIAIDRRNNDMFIGFNFQSKLPSGLPDYEPAVMKMDREGRLVWWSRMYTESTDPACANKSQLFTSLPDQYVDGLAIDYKTNNVVVNARCHGNDSKNYWTSNNAFQRSFTGTNGNIHLSWLGKLKLADGAFTSGTYVAGYNWKAPTGKKYTDPNLAGWPDHNNGAVNDLNTTKLIPNKLKVDNNGGVTVIGSGQRVVTTKNAYMEQDSIFDSAAPWTDFVRIFNSDFSKVSYSSIVHSSFVPGGQFYNGGDINLQGVVPLANGALVVGYNKADPTNNFDVDCRNVPFGWGMDNINGPTPFLAKLTGEVVVKPNNIVLPANPAVTRPSSTSGDNMYTKGSRQVYLPDGSSIGYFDTSNASSLLWKVDLFNGDSIVGLHRTTALVKWNSAGRKEWSIDMNYGYDAPAGHDHHYPVIDKRFAPSGRVSFLDLESDSEGSFYLALGVIGGPDSIAGQPKFLYPKSYMATEHDKGICDSIPWPCFLKGGDKNNLKRVTTQVILKYNSSGRFQWSKTFAGDGWTNTWGGNSYAGYLDLLVKNDELLAIWNVSSATPYGIGKVRYAKDGTESVKVNNGNGTPSSVFRGYTPGDWSKMIHADDRVFVLRKHADGNGTNSADLNGRVIYEGMAVQGGNKVNDKVRDLYIFELDPVTMKCFPRYTRLAFSYGWPTVEDFNFDSDFLTICDRKSTVAGRAKLYLSGLSMKSPQRPIGYQCWIDISGSETAMPIRTIVSTRSTASSSDSQMPFVIGLFEGSTNVNKDFKFDVGCSAYLEDQLWDAKKLTLTEDQCAVDMNLAANSNSDGDFFMAIEMQHENYNPQVKINNSGTSYPTTNGPKTLVFKMTPTGTFSYFAQTTKNTCTSITPISLNFDNSGNPTITNMASCQPNKQLEYGTYKLPTDRSGYVFSKLDKSTAAWSYVNTFRYTNIAPSYLAPGMSSPLKFCDEAYVQDLFDAAKFEKKATIPHYYKHAYSLSADSLSRTGGPIGRGEALQNDSVYYAEQWWIGDSIMSKRIPVTVKIFKTPILNKAGIASYPLCQTLNNDGKIKLYGATADEGVVYWAKDRNFSTYEVGDTVYHIQSPTTEPIKKYYFQAVNGGKCQSSIDSITITLMPSLKMSNDTICGAGKVTLKAKPIHWVRSGSGTSVIPIEVAAAGTIKWYDAQVGGTLLHTEIISVGGESQYKPILADGEQKSYWAEVSAGICGAYQRYKVDAYSFGAVVTTKISNDTIICGQGSVILKASSSKPLAQVSWYADAACTNLLFQGGELEVPSKNPSYSSTYYAKASYNGRCEGNTIQIKVEWRKNAEISSVEHDTICGTGVATLKATPIETAQTINWYTSLSGGTAIASGNTFTPTVSKDSIFYAEADNGICGVSPRVAVRAVVKNLPSLSGVLSNSIPETNVVAKVNTTYIDIKPVVSGIVNSYSLTGTLPVGLTFNASTGEIKGTPTSLHTSTNYSLNAINSCGNVSISFTITVNDLPPTTLAYSPTIIIATKGITVINATPTVAGGAVMAYSISPTLPTGVIINSTTGVISGTPTVLLAQTQFTITASNTGGSTTGIFTLTVNDSSPSGLSYSPSPVVATKAITVINASPTVAGGAVMAYSISPTLPTGVIINSTTGVISGTPTVLLAQTQFTITATNTGGSTTGTFTLTVNDSSPSGLSYLSSPVVATKGVTVINATPTVSGGAVTAYSISPALPSGVTLNSTTGVISGTTTSLLPTTAFTITASNTGGSTTGIFTLTVNDSSPSGLSYLSSPVVATKGVTVINASPTVSGGAVTAYSISPALPSGVTLNSTTGVISGTPTSLLPTTAFTITASNTGGSTTGTFTLTVNDSSPSGLSYLSSPVVATKGVTVINASPTVAGGAVMAYSISPALPSGVTLNSTTGVISGTPTSILPTTAFTITATNTGGSTTGTFTLTVNDPSPSGLSYSPNPVVATKAVTVINATPTVSGGAVTSYSISPALPTGVTINTTTGFISGTPTVLLVQTQFIITASNTGGNTTGTFMLTVNDSSPSGLSYSPNPVVATKAVTVINATPTVSGGAVTAYSISPTLPTGVIINSTTGVISGTPTVLLAQTQFTITATNTGGSTSGTFTLTVNDPSPTAIVYTPSSVVATKGVTILNAIPTFSGSLSGFSISPALPTGVTINTTTGVISGTPTVLLVQTQFTITAINTGGSTTGTFTLTVNDPSPTAIVYNPSNVVATKGVTSLNAIPSYTGSLSGFSISPALPTGITINTTTGVISGTPTVLLVQTQFTITATNTGGSTSGTFTLTVNDPSPTAIVYTPTSEVAIKGVTKINAIPYYTGNLSWFNISPSLPTGVTINTTTGIISGTPTVLLVQTQFTITATNTGGNTTGVFTLTVNDSSPSGLSYSPNPVIATKGVTVINATPTVSGGAVTSYSISPALPSGVLINPSTGIISGTPTVLLVQTQFTITATNTGGSTTGTFTLTVNDSSPSGLSYSLSPVIATKGVTVINATPTVSGGAVTSYSISPALPSGVLINPSTGKISGTPTVLLVQTQFTITGINTGGSTSGTFTLTVNDPSPTAIVYNPSNVVATKGVTTLNAIPSYTGSLSGFSISPALPAGITLNTSTGIISGTPTVLLVQTQFTITATNRGGSTTGTFMLTVNDPAPSAIVYNPTSEVAIKGVTMINAIPSYTGNLSWFNISPSLPTGVTINTTTGVISGTPTALLNTTEFVITAGNTSGMFTLTVNDPWYNLDKLPNTFTPNNDGVNDIFMKGYTIEIYNRNGFKLFEGTDGWDGTYKGQIIQNGTYFYMLKIQLQNEVKIKNGYITVYKQ